MSGMGFSACYMDLLFFTLLALPILYYNICSPVMGPLTLILLNSFNQEEKIGPELLFFKQLF